MLNDSSKSDFEMNDSDPHSHLNAARELYFVTGDRIAGRRVRNTPEPLPACQEKLSSDAEQSKTSDEPESPERA